MASDGGTDLCGTIGDAKDHSEVTLPHQPRTRGDVRRLCASLGIELREGGK